MLARIRARLGAKLALSSLQNFTATVALLRERAPAAGYHERLTGPKREIPFAGSGAASPDPVADLLAPLLALWASKSSAPASGAGP